MISKNFRLMASITATVIFATGASAPNVYAQATPKLQQEQAGFYRLKIGAVDVTALSDGTVSLYSKLLLSKRGSDVERLLKQGYVQSPLDTSVNAYMMRLENRVILIDVGTGQFFGPSLDKLPNNLRAVGVEPGQITDIFLTHIHTDHSGGLMDGATRVFPNATVHIARAEMDYWFGDDGKEKAQEHHKAFFDQAKLTVGPYIDAGQVKTFEGAMDLLPGLRSVPAPGHTPGHTYYALESRGEKIVFWGDVLHVAAVQLPVPGVAIQFDVSPAEAVASRRRAFAEAARDGYLVAPSHMSFPGVGRLRRDGQGYRWIPLPYINDANPQAVSK